jgi:hypothetical protein
LATMTLPLDVTDVNIVGDQLEAVISLAGQEVGTVPIDVTTTEAPAGAADDCPILNLHLGPINLDLLGLQVDTSEICLDVTATDDQGLLGSLLCDLTGGVGLGGIGGIRDQLDNVVGQVDAFLGRIEDLLDSVLDQAFTVTDVLGSPLTGGGVGAAQDGEVCDILGLALGPIDLDVPLLGVSVNLDNCEGGPVTIDVNADEEGGLLGSLLCGLADGIDPTEVNTNRLVRQLDRLVDRLGVLADRLDDLPRVTPDIRNLTRQLERFADRVDNLRELDQLMGKVDGLISRANRVIRRLA